MGLDLYYELKTKDLEDCKLVETDTYKILNDHIYSYYRLNWSGVKIESRFLLFYYLLENIEKEDSINSDSIYIYENINNNFDIGKIKEIDNIKRAILLNKAVLKLKENNTRIFNPITFLSFDLWNGSNGEVITLTGSWKRKTRFKNKRTSSSKRIYNLRLKHNNKIIRNINKLNTINSFDLNNTYKILNKMLEDYKDDYILLKSKEVLDTMICLNKTIKNMKAFQYESYFG